MYIQIFPVIMYCYSIPQTKNTCYSTGRRTTTYMTPVLSIIRVVLPRRAVCVDIIICINVIHPARGHGLFDRFKRVYVCHLS
jgi:hypothetical protein